MAKNTKIGWVDHTFNAWTGCTKVSPACDHCYAESWAKRSGHVEWGPHAERRLTKTWNDPLRWNKALEGTGRQETVFCNSLSDVFDNHHSITKDMRSDLYDLWLKTPNLIWMPLTKRPQNIMKLVEGWFDLMNWPANVWIGTTVENQQQADIRIPHLLQVPAPVRYVSCEPLLGTLDFCSTRLTTESQYRGNVLRRGSRLAPHLHWVIVGGESGNGYRELNMDHVRDIRDQCKANHTPFFFKQRSGRTQSVIVQKGREIDGVVHDEFPVPGLIT